MGFASVNSFLSFCSRIKKAAEQSEWHFIFSYSHCVPRTTRQRSTAPANISNYSYLVCTVTEIIYRSPPQSRRAIKLPPIRFYIWFFPFRRNEQFYCSANACTTIFTSNCDAMFAPHLPLGGSWRWSGIFQFNLSSWETESIMRLIERWGEISSKNMHKKKSQSRHHSNGNEALEIK